LISLGLKPVARVEAIALRRLGGSATEAAVAPPRTAAPVSSLRREKRGVSILEASSDKVDPFAEEPGMAPDQRQSDTQEITDRSPHAEDPTT
jgi:hypothetical protein